jgi:hypothetical protein
MCETGCQGVGSTTGRAVIHLAGNRIRFPRAFTPHSGILIEPLLTFKRPTS